MRTSQEIAKVMELAAAGSGSSDIARRTGIPRSTVREWLAGRTPRAGGAGCDVCGGGVHDMSGIAPEYLYLLGVYLGDGCISSHPRGVYRLRVVLDSRYPSIIEECAASMQTVAPGRRVGSQQRSGGFSGSSHGSSIELNAYSKSWPCLFPQHGPGRKHARRIVLSPWQSQLLNDHPEPLLRGLIHSDGCRFINSGRNWRHARYSFSNRSADIREIFCDACDRLGVHWTLAPDTVYVSRVDDVALLDTFIGPKS